MKNLSPWLIAIVLCGLLAGCQSSPQRLHASMTDEAVEPLADWPDPPSRQGQHYLVDRQASEVRMVVLAAGPLARFGHPHVVGGPVVDGRIIIGDGRHDAGLELTIAVGDLELDHPEWRADEGFDPDMPDGAIEATRENLLSTQVLDQARFPLIRVRSLSMTGPAWQADLRLAIQLKDQIRALTVPVAIERHENQLIATSRFEISQRAFGITPFSAAGGALQVDDRILIRLRIVARLESEA